MNVDCGGGKKPSFAINDLGAAQCDVPEFNQTRPNANVIMFRDDSFSRPEDNIPFDAIALTTLSYNPETGELFGADIELNAANWNFVTGPLRAGNDVDLQAVLTHETGHFLGLSHGSPQDVTMYWRYLPTAERRILKQDDKDGICAVFPPGQAVNENQCAPFNGYSPECQPDTPLDEDEGCAIASGAPRGSGFAAFAAALGFFALLRRRRR